MEVIEKVKLHVIDFFEKHPNQQLVFHTLEHTLSVVQQAELIGQAEGLAAEDLQAVIIAAWFHDTGYLLQQENHEGASITVANAFFEKNPVDETLKKQVIDCIDVTCRKREPKSLAECVVLDADVAHVADENFIQISKKLKREIANCQNSIVKFKDYWGDTLSFLEGLTFYTGYAKARFPAVLKKNIEKVRALLEEGAVKEAQKQHVKKKRNTEKGIESMFRLTASNQMRLSSIGDKKANILISINSILISVSAAVATRQAMDYHDFLPALVVLFLSSLISLIFAILSCRPEMKPVNVSDQDLKQRKINLLFFGNFNGIPYPRYHEAMREMMDDYDYLYGNLIKDQYNLGKTLYRKYKLLRIAYNIFMYGFILAAVVFVINYMMFK
jgi:predicted metal-dependent HD superfamily phosphohydrolase